MDDLLATDAPPTGAPPDVPTKDESATPSEPWAIAELLREHRGLDALVLDLRPMNTWTDFFVIATASSDTHLDGLERHVKEFCTEQGIDILRRSRKPAVSHGTREQEDEWRIIDLGSTVIHLMSGRARAFYDLERLYSMTFTQMPSSH